MGIRNSAKALILRGNKLLTIMKQSGPEIYYLLPGGGQEFKETLKDTVIRECMEEVGAQVEVKDLIMIREYIGENHEFPIRHKDVHQMEYIFAVTTEEKDFTKGTHLDEEQIGIEWLPIETLHTKNFYPKAMREYIQKYARCELDQTYLGDIN
jgi:8-oxo-dGTP diphosphatase